MHDISQPFVRLAQANSAVLTKFVHSLEAKSQVATSVKKLTEQLQAPMVQLVESNAFGKLWMDLMENNSRFVVELTQSGIDWLGESQAALISQVPEVFNNGAESTDEAHRSRRIRQVG